MSIGKFTGHKRLTVLGINSGTSADGLDMAVVSVSRNGAVPEYTFLEGAKQGFSKKLQDAILRLADSKMSNLDEVVYLDNVLGQVMGQKAAKFMANLEKYRIQIDGVASHGQTVRHSPRSVFRHGKHVRGSLQLGSLDQIAAGTGKLVIGDFRQAEIAVGQEGAPITIGAMQRLFASDKSTVIVNIGGIANYFYLPSRSSSRFASGRDCGPGNCIVDYLAKALYNRRFDKDGQKALRGMADTRILDEMLGEPFFSSHTASTGREEFGPAVAEKLMKLGEQEGLSREDLMATAAELTVAGIAVHLRTLARQDRSIDTVYLSGGGRNNRYFQTRLANYLPDFSIRLVDELGIHGDYVEAASYAVMGEACLRSEPMSRSPDPHGSQSRWPVLGHIVQPPLEGR